MMVTDHPCCVFLFPGVCGLLGFILVWRMPPKHQKLAGTWNCLVAVVMWCIISLEVSNLFVDKSAWALSAMAFRYAVSKSMYLEPKTLSHCHHSH